MRMFLVGMCDIFLILYLTTLGEVDARRISRLTVADYRRLEDSEAVLRERLSGRETEHESVVRAIDESRLDAELRLADLAAELRQIKERTRGEEDRVVKLHQQLNLSKESEAALNLDLSRREKELAKLSSERVALQDRLDAARKEHDEEVARKEQLAATLVRHREQEELLKTELEQAKLREQEAMLEAQRSLNSAAVAEKKALLAQQAALAAAQRERRAIDVAHSAAEVAAQARDFARSTDEIAETAVQERSKVQSRLSAITQPTGDLFDSTYRDTILTVQVSHQEQGLLGRSSHTQNLHSIPVSFGEEAVIFIVLSQIGISGGSDLSKLAKLTFTVGNATLSRAHASRELQDLVAIVVPETAKTTAPVKLADSMRGHFAPTMFAVRNSRPARLADKVRGLSQDYFLVQRDYFEPLGRAFLRYSPKGFRGTGDFGEQILRGDQLIDPEGLLVGVAVEDNLVRVVDKGGEWRAYEAIDGNFTPILEEIILRWQQ